MRCPICKKTLEEAAAGQKSYYPFCSERCKLVDLGRWLSGKYQISDPLTDQSVDRDGSDEILPRRDNAGAADDD